ncbi:MAG: Tripartite tricarboxylate transporter TctB family [Deltaproteobacteria bacterium]|nr:Tripartite tricarboxylate transporter TctB family [Deltaproteobacteria bacterium]
MDEKSKSSDLFLVILGAVGALLLILTPYQVPSPRLYPFYKGPRIFPILSLSLVILASLPATVRLIRGRSGTSWRVDGYGMPVKAALFLAVSVLLMFAISWIGLEISCFFYLAGCLYWLGHRSPARFLGISIIYTAVLVIIFKYVLGLYLPEPLLLKLFQ